MANREKCPNCENLLILPSGPPNSSILVVGEHPEKEEVIYGVPLIGPNGEILKMEMARIGLQLASCRMTNLWQHSKNEDNCDVEWHMNKVAKEIAGRKYVLILGSEVCRKLWDTGVMDISGLTMKHTLFPKTVFIPCPNPGLLRHAPIGEFRLAMKRFKEVSNGNK